MNFEFWEIDDKKKELHYVNKAKVLKDLNVKEDDFRKYIDELQKNQPHKHLSYIITSPHWIIRKTNDKKSKYKYVLFNGIDAADEDIINDFKAIDELIENAKENNDYIDIDDVR